MSRFFYFRRMLSGEVASQPFFYNRLKSGNLLFKRDSSLKSPAMPPETGLSGDGSRTGENSLFLERAASFGRRIFAFQTRRTASWWMASVFLNFLSRFFCFRRMRLCKENWAVCAKLNKILFTSALLRRYRKFEFYPAFSYTSSRTFRNAKANLIWENI